MPTSTSHVSASNLGLTIGELGVITKGWSLKNDILGKDVFNDANENIGTVEDLLVTRDKAISYAIIGVGGFLGMGRHDVAIPVYNLRMNKTRVTLPGGTAEGLKALPAFSATTES
ncbi:PRC-barrel domain-containing protein [Desulfovibrio sp. DV]|uniref:PRC-barrel domain-containing protein n=1 Tax=Desulfovibrio sp. DV TaxID=1844708 RepID=UPI00094BBB04|nr:PRC-barrel domain-containing protein [Desulfovibrio sp. DV]